MCRGSIAGKYANLKKVIMNKQQKKRREAKIREKASTARVGGVADKLCWPCRFSYSAVLKNVLIPNNASDDRNDNC